MRHITISAQEQPAFSGRSLGYAVNTAQAKRMELRIAELDLAHIVEATRLDTLPAMARQKLFSSERRRG